MTDLASSYDQKYRHPDYFLYREWLFRPYISSLVSFCGLQPGNSVLDVGCGQGFFSYLLTLKGLRVHGVDLSAEGVRAAVKSYSKYNITFEVGDALQLETEASYDCVFVRSFSLYNTRQFRAFIAPTESLLRYVKRGGKLLFVYNSRLTPSDTSDWRHHSISEARDHFRSFRADVFFSSRLDTLLLGKYAFNNASTVLNACASKVLNVGGDLICIVTK